MYKQVLTISEVSKWLSNNNLLNIVGTKMGSGLWDM